MRSFVIRHATKNEVLNQAGFMPRERMTPEGRVVDDHFGMTFDTEGDAIGWLKAINQDRDGHQIVPREDRTPEGTFIGSATIDAADFYGAR